jgi:hypothetical protein
VYQKGEGYDQCSSDRSTQNEANDICFLLVISPVENHDSGGKHHKYDGKEPSRADVQHFRQGGIESHNGSQPN